MARDDFARAKDLAAYRSRVRSSWHGVHVEHVESSGVSDSPQVGDTLHVRALVSLGSLAPEDVDVEVVYGRASESDELSNTKSAPLALAARDDGRAMFEGDLRLRSTGAFGYTVRVLPKHDGLSSPTELGLVTNA